MWTNLEQDTPTPHKNYVLSSLYERKCVAFVFLSLDYLTYNSIHFPVSVIFLIFTTK